MFKRTITAPDGEELTLVRVYDDWVDEDDSHHDVNYRTVDGVTVVNNLWGTVTMQFSPDTPIDEACMIVHKIWHKYNDQLA